MQALKHDTSTQTAILVRSSSFLLPSSSSFLPYLLHPPLLHQTYPLAPPTPPYLHSFSHVLCTFPCFGWLTPSIKILPPSLLHLPPSHSHTADFYSLSLQCIPAPLQAIFHLLPIRVIFERHSPSLQARMISDVIPPPT